MTPDLPSTDRCPSCGATVRFGDPWCTLCYADLRPPAPAVEPEPVADPVDAPAYSLSPDPLSAPLEAVAAPGAGSAPVEGPSWPCSACGTVNPMARDTCSACGLHFLATMRAEEAPILELPVVGDITKLSRGHRFAIAAGVVLAFLILTVLLGVIFG